MQSAGPLATIPPSSSHNTIITQPPWLLHDASLRRFSAPATDNHRDRLTAHMTSATAAYAKAFLLIQKSHKDPQVRHILSNSTEQDLAETAMNLCAATTTSPDQQNKMSKLVDILHHYHGVFDVLSQADFSYLTLIWGGMKLILIMTKNRTELLTKITDMLVEIGLNLSRVELYTKLFPTTRMIELTSMMYAAVVEFLQEIIRHFQHNTVRQMFSSLVRPFEEKFGRAMDRIHRLENTIQKDALLMQALQTASMAEHRIDSFLQRQHMESALNGIPQGQVPDIFLQIKKTLFKGFSEQASYHEDLAATYGVTSSAWESWFRLEQSHLPSGMSPRTRLTQGLCDAPDAQHALQWASQQRAQSPHIPSAYLIWARGLTAHSAIASLIFQVLQQRPAVISEHNLDMRMFMRASTSIKALWDIFTHLMRVLGGCLLYITIGSVGPDEFAIVEKFVKTVQSWDGPPISVTIIHPLNKGFVCTDDVTDLDGLYDVHPSLCTTDALHHVLLLELDVHGGVSDTIHSQLWESVWREVRYAVIGIALTQVTRTVQAESEKYGQRLVEAKELSSENLEIWRRGCQKWMDNEAAMNNVREQIQRHLEIVDLGLPDEIRPKLVQSLKLLVLSADTTDRSSSSSTSSSIGPGPMTQPQRGEIWDRIQEDIAPGTVAMFCGSVREFVEDGLDDYSCAVPGQSAKQAVLGVVRILDRRFGWDAGWKESFSGEKGLVVDGIAKGIVTGFEGVIEALSTPK